MRTTSVSQSSSAYRRVVSAADFGAVGNGIVDDTAALQAALNSIAPGGNLLLVPPGKYKTSNSLRLRLEKQSAIPIVGLTAYGATLISGDKDGRPILHVTADAPVQQLVIEGLAIDGKARNLSQHGLLIESGTGIGSIYSVSLRDISVDRCGGCGCELVGTIGESQIMNCYFSRNHDGLVLRSRTDGATISSVHVFGCSFDQNTVHGIEAAAATGAAAPNDLGCNGCYFADNGQFGAYLPNGCAYLTNCVFENNWASASSASGGGPGVFLSNGGTMLGCSGNGNRHQNYLVKGHLSGTLTMVGCSVAGTKTKLFSLGGQVTAKARIVGCRGIREYQGRFAAQATEIANLP